MILNTIIQFIKLTRAHIGIAVLPSFWLGSLFALILGFPFHLSIFLIGFLIIFLIYASASYINDYYDFEADQHNRQFGFSGGSGVLQQYPELREKTRWFAFLFIIIALLLTTFLAFFTYLPFWAIGFIGIGAFFAWFYSAPPFRFSYRGIGEFPHFIAGLMNAGWGYLLITGTIDLNVIIFAIPLSLHLLNVILIFEIPDREADIHGGKTNYIVKHGRKQSFLLISLIFWIATFFFFLLAWFEWYNKSINFWLLAFLSLIPSLVSTTFYFKKSFEQKPATTYAIRTAFSLFGFSLVMLAYFVSLELL